MGPYIHWFYIAAVAVTVIAAIPTIRYTKAIGGADVLNRFHLGGSAAAIAELTRDWPPEKFGALRNLLRADLRFLFAYPLIFIVIAIQAQGRFRVVHAAIGVLAAVLAGYFDWRETMAGLEVLSNPSDPLAESMRKSSKRKWEWFALSALACGAGMDSRYFVPAGLLVLASPFLYNPSRRVLQKLGFGLYALAVLVLLFASCRAVAQTWATP